MSEKCGQLGFEIPRNTITNLENGRKTSIPVHEVLVLALALNVRPLDLLFPAATDEKVLFPGGEREIVGSAVWFSSAGFFANLSAESASELSLYVDHHRQIQRVEMRADARHESLGEAVHGLRTLRALLGEKNLRLPELPSRVEQLLEDPSLTVADPAEDLARFDEWLAER